MGAELADAGDNGLTEPLVIGSYMSFPSPLLRSGIRPFAWSLRRATDKIAVQVSCSLPPEFAHGILNIQG